MNVHKDLEQANEKIFDNITTSDMREELVNAYGEATVNDEIIDMLQDHAQELYNELILERYREAKGYGDL